MSSTLLILNMKQCLCGALPGDPKVKQCIPVKSKLICLETCTLFFNIFCNATAKTYLNNSPHYLYNSSKLTRHCFNCNSQDFQWYFIIHTAETSSKPLLTDEIQHKHCEVWGSRRLFFFGQEIWDIVARPPTKPVCNLGNALSCWKRKGLLLNNSWLKCFMQAQECVFVACSFVLDLFRNKHEEFFLLKILQPTPSQIRVLECGVCFQHLLDITEHFLQGPCHFGCCEFLQQ